MTDKIKGVSFTDYAATCAFLAQGKDISELLPTLGIDAATWDAVNEGWQAEMASNDPEFKLAIQLGEIFQNPAQGVYAGASSETVDDALALIPDLDAYLTLTEEMRLDTEAGGDPSAFLTKRGISISAYANASKVYHQEIAARSSSDSGRGNFVGVHADDLED